MPGMQEPSPHTSRIAIAAGLAVALGLAGAGFLAGRSTAPGNAPTEPGGIAVPTAAPPSDAPRDTGIAVALDRAALLTLARLAADAHASGQPMPAEVEAAAGRRFDLVMPFGCAAAGASASPGRLGWSFDAASATLRVAADPVIWPAADWAGAASPDGPAAYRGFWIDRPWSSATDCGLSGRLPPAPDEPATTSPAPTVQTLAIARVVDPEAGGKARAYQVVRRSSPTDFDPQQGFRLRILGRLRPPGGPDPVRCVQPGGAAQPPACLIVASFSEVHIEDGKTGSVLASWPIGPEPRAGDGLEAGGANR